jgi:hypothetical protein
VTSDQELKIVTCGRETCTCSHEPPCDGGWEYVEGDPANGVPDTVRHCYRCGGARRQRSGETRTDWLGRLQTPLHPDPEGSEVPPPPSPYYLNRQPGQNDQPITNPVIMVACPFCKAPMGTSCTVTGTGKVMRHLRYHPSRYVAADVEQPPPDMMKLADDPLTDEMIRQAFVSAAEAEEREKV